jgi:carbon-monoxide dehydrogenase medium subunit
VKPAAFAYHAPDTLEEALALRAAHAGEGVALAGGQSLVPILNLRLAAPSVLIDLRRIRELAAVTVERGRLRLGAMTRQRDAERSTEVGAASSLLAQALPWVGHPSTRNRGTVGGSLAHADPAAELPTVALALDAELELHSARGGRVVAAEDFFHGFMSTAIEPDELLVAISLPVDGPRTGTSFVEVARRHGDFALVAAAAVVRLRDDEGIAAARVVIAGVDGTPVRAHAAEQQLEGARPHPGLFAEAAARAAADLEPHDDLHASAAYRRHVAGVLVARVLRTAAERAREAA